MGAFQKRGFANERSGFAWNVGRFPALNAVNAILLDYTGRRDFAQEGFQTWYLKMIQKPPEHLER